MGKPNSFLCFTSNRMVKDLRSNYEDTDPDSVLDGNIDKLIFSNINLGK